MRQSPGASLALPVERSAADVGASAVCAQDGLKGIEEIQEVAVVDATAVDLAGKRAEQSRPVMARRRRGDGHLDASLDDLHG
ncbi:hypothetical protein [Geodermatophilus sp. SYSU D01119]